MHSGDGNSWMTSYAMPTSKKLMAVTRGTSWGTLTGPESILLNQGDIVAGTNPCLSASLQFLKFPWRFFAPISVNESFLSDDRLQE
jgi:hypothetical protein